MRYILKDHIRAVVEGIKHLSVDDAADLIAEIADEERDHEDHYYDAAILDGLRWGYAAAVVVEMGGGAMARFVMPGGVTITNEWALDADADQPIKAALAAIHSARVTATGVGEAQ